MSLYALKIVSPAFGYPTAADIMAYPEYVPDSGCWLAAPGVWPTASNPTGSGSGGTNTVYNPSLVTCPRKYPATVSALSHFFYDPGSDQLYMHVQYTTSWWPSWDTRALIFDADSGSWQNRDSVLGLDSDSYCGIWGVAWTSCASVGSYGRIFGSDLGTLKSLDPLTSRPDGVWTAPSGLPTTVLTGAVVNIIDGYVAIGSGGTLDFYRNINTAPEKFETIYLPAWIDSMCYESGEILWAICRHGEIFKINYQIPRIEMVSSVQNPDATALGYRITFDTTRHRVIVCRWLPDATDGACTSQLEYYYPMSAAATLTKPVPYTSLKTNSRIGFVAHLIGSQGEPITPWGIAASLAEPAAGQIVVPSVTTGVGGRALIEYKSSATGCTETIQLSTTTEEV